MTVYLDNSATSWPKPPSVVEAISSYLVHCGASPGRSGHRLALQAAKEVFETRELVAQLFNVSSSERVIFTSNATHAINIALKGVLKKGDHVIVSAFEHNATIRPLREMEASGIVEISVIGLNSQGEFDLEGLRKAIRPNTRMVTTIHASNVTGHVHPIQSIGAICKENNLLFMVDASQSAGVIPIDMQAYGIDLLAFTGHKKLYGPTGIGGLCIADHVHVRSLIQGGTGSYSEMEYQPNFYPDALEAGTLNTVGIVGLKAGLEFVMGQGINNLYNHQLKLTNLFLGGLRRLETVSVHAGVSSSKRVGVVSITANGISPSTLAYELDNQYGIMVRSGLHCAPMAHKALGTFPQGTVRFSFGCFNTEEEVRYTLEALIGILKTRNTETLRH